MSALAKASGQRGLSKALLLLCWAFGSHIAAQSAAPAALPSQHTTAATQAAASSHTDAAGTLTVIQGAPHWQHSFSSGLELVADALVVGARGYGSVLGPELTLPAFNELIPSWNTRTWSSGSAEVEVRVKQGERWSNWYTFGLWSKAEGRASAPDQLSSAGELKTDLLKLSEPAQGLQYRVFLRGEGAKLNLLAFHTSLQPLARAQASSALPMSPVSAPTFSTPISTPNPQSTAQAWQPVWGKVLSVPAYSQLAYKGGDGWCSPTSMAMILQRHGLRVSVPEAAKGTYDLTYGGTGNWPFNAAFAAELGLRAFITRLPNLAAAEAYIALNVPLIVSLSWKEGELVGAPLPRSTGHLMVLTGFDVFGNPTVNDPAAPQAAGVQRTYDRAQFERLWQRHHAGLTYVIAGANDPLPLPQADLPQAALPQADLPHAQLALKPTRGLQPSEQPSQQHVAKRRYSKPDDF